MSVCHGCRFSPEKIIWLNLGVLLLLLQETAGQITVTQTPSVVVAKLNQNATLACRFSHTPDRGVKGVILYWYRMGPNGRDEYAYPPKQARPEYKNRVVPVDRSRTAEDRSVVLLNVSWTDSHRYRCLLSYETAKDPERKRGDGVLLLLHDSMSFDRVPEMERSLRCSVRVSPDPGFQLAVFRNGVQVDSVGNHTPGPHVTLALQVPVLDGAEYECRLNHSSRVLLRQKFSAPDLPEPVFLYVAILLVPFIIFIVFLSAFLFTKSRR